jgi:streptogramin lyase
MKLYRLAVPIGVGLFMAIATVAAFASGRPAPAGPPLFNASETNLSPSSFADQIHVDASGKLWISEVFSGSVREFDPATNAYTLYSGLTKTVDAQLGPDGNLWWAGGSASQNLSRMDLSSRIVTSWPLSVTGVQALAFDGSQRVWAAAAIIKIGLYRLNPATNQLCDVDLPDNGQSLTLVAQNGELWVGDITNQRIGRIDPATNAFTYWSLASLGGFPRPAGFAFDPSGNVWWADSGLAKIGRLQPKSNQAALFGPAGLSGPQRVAYSNGKVWFTDPFTASLAYLDPAVAVGSAPVVVTPTTTSLTPVCASVVPAPAFTAHMTTGVASFSPVVFTTTTAGSQGTLYQAPAGGEPWGLALVGFNLYATDVGRDKLIHRDTAAAHLFLPLTGR